MIGWNETSEGFYNDKDWGEFKRKLVLLFTRHKTSERVVAVRLEGW